MKDFCKKNPRISTRDEVERNEVKSAHHHLITLKDHLMKKYHIYGFEKLEVYKLALSLSIEIRRLVKSFPKEEQFDLTRQLKRATDSINLSSIIKLRFIFQ